MEECNALVCDAEKRFCTEVRIFLGKQIILSVVYPLICNSPALGRWREEQ